MALSRNIIPVCIAVCALAACRLVGDGGQLVADNTAGSCVETTGKQEVLSIMQDWYLWNDEAEQADKYRNLDLSGFTDVDDLLDYLRYRPGTFDRGFTYTTTPDQENSYFDEGQFIGFGFSLIQPSAGTLRIAQVFKGSPADAAGIERGFTLTRIDGRSILDIASAEGINAALGPDETGVSHTLTFENTAGTPLAPMTLTKAVVTLDPLPLVTIIRDSSNQPIAGYLFFRTFISSADQALRDAFAQLAQASVTRLIVDLRYNGGGLVSTAQVAASLMAGPGNTGNVFSYHHFNSDRAADADFTLTFNNEPNAIDLDTLVFITSGGTASASELLINGLEPYFTAPDKVAVVGTRSFGKPVGQSAFDFCQHTQRLRAVTFKTENVAGAGDYFNGLPVDCPASDDLSRMLGDKNEDMLKTALSVVQTGGCPIASLQPATVSADGRTTTSRPVAGRRIWQQDAYAF